MRTFVLLLIGMISLTSFGQLIEFPKTSIELNLEQSKGRNACAVVYNPKNELYYSLVAGNSQFPIEVYTSSGKNIYQGEIGNDIRGVWWNKKSGNLEANCYTDDGLVSIGLDEKGYPTVGNSIIFSGKEHQPVENSCGAFDGKKYLYYFEEGKIFIYGRKDGAYVKTVDLSGLPGKVYDLNYTTVIYTAEKKMEIGLLDYVNKKVLLFNKKDMSYTATVQLPADAVTSEAFRFAYANKHVFLWDLDNRKWDGYRIFQ